MQFRGLDLNLLVVLDALLTEQNTTRAGELVFLGQSATSAALARLREFFGDESITYDLMYFGEDGRPVFMPKPDGPAVILATPYRTDSSQTLDAKPPVPYRTFSETFEY